MKIEIKPFQGINEIKFDMTQEEIKKILGDAAKIEINNITRQTIEFRNGMQFKIIDHKLKDIIVSKHVELFYNDIDLFNSINTIELLSQFDEPIFGKNGYVNFYNLGLSLGGFGKKRIPEDKLVIIFAKDRIDFYKIYLEV